jgi:hypothetical protein
MSTPASPSPHRRSVAGRVVALIGAGVAGLLAAGLIVAGGILLWADHEKDRDGYLTTSTERLATGTRALATQDMDIDLDGAGTVLDGHLGTVRLHVESANGKPVFAGIARTDDVDRYLRGTSHARVTDIDVDPFEPELRNVPGSRVPVAPATSRIWAASVSGSGPRTLEWKVRDGHWSVVLMRADGARGVAADVSAGARVPFLAPAGWGALGGGVVLLGFAALFLYLGVRSSPTPPPAAPSPAAPAGTTDPLLA